MAGAAVVGTGVVGASVGVTVPPQALGAAGKHQLSLLTVNCAVKSFTEHSDHWLL